MILDMQGGFRTEERGGVEMKVSSYFMRILIFPKNDFLHTFSGKRFDANILAY